MSSLLSRFVEVWRSGTMFGGARDMYKVFGWKRDPQHQDFVFKYRHQALAKRIINAPVNALWSDPPVLEGDDAFNEAWSNLLSQIPVFSCIQRLDKLAGLGKYAILVIGFDDGADLSQPVKPSPDRKVLYLQPYSEGLADIDQLDEQTNSPRFGQPLMYKINPGKNETVSGVTVSLRLTRELRVHHSRVLHVAEGALESLVYGRSRLESCYNELDDLSKVSGGSAETYWLTANRGLHVDVDKEMELDEDDEANLSDELKEYQHELRRTIRTRGVKITELGSNVADPSGAFDVQVSLIASDTGIPKRILTGSEAGQLASQQDRASWAQTIAERITEYGEPTVLLPFIRKLIFAGVLPSPSSLKIKWPDAFKMNPLERAQTSAQMARSATNIMKALETQENINQSMARAALPTVEPANPTPSPFGNADPKKPDPKAPNKEAVKMVEKPPLMEARDPIEVITPEEARHIIGFGKHAPIFDEKSDTKDPAIGSPEGGK